MSCRAWRKTKLSRPRSAISSDGTVYGLDGTIWGGEFLRVTDRTPERFAHLQPFRLPGGDAAVKEPRRVAIGLLYEMFGDPVFARSDLPPAAAFSKTELAALKTMLAKELNSPVTTSMGGLFDAVASIVGLRQQMRFEGQAAMELEFALNGIETDEAYSLRIADCGLRNKKAEGGKRKAEIILDWTTMIEEILADVKKGVSVSEISAKFHNALAEADC